MHPAVNMLAGPQLGLGAYGFPKVGGMPGMEGLLGDATGMHVGQIGHMGQLHLGGQQLGMVAPMAYARAGMPGAGLMGLQAAPVSLGPMQASVYDASVYGSAAQGVGQDPSGLGDAFSMGQPGTAPGLELTQMAMSLALNQQQLAGLNQHLFSVQTVSGAQLHISPGAPGLFHLVISGTKGQVETAKNLVSTVLGGNAIL